MWYTEFEVIEVVTFKLRDLLAERIAAGKYDSEREFVLKIGERQNSMYDVLNGKTKRVPVTLIDAVCRELKVAPGDWIIYEEDAPTA